jgi:Glucosidase II beta subunit-like protein
MRNILLFVALVGLGTLHFSNAIPYVYDELLYTKQLWDEYKLDFPYSVFKEDDEVIARAKDSLAGLFSEDSLSGPQSNLAELIDQDLKRGEFQPNSFDVSLIDDSTPLPGAASVAQCKTCLALATVMWQGLVQWSHRYMGTVAAHDLIEYGESLCEYEVPEVVLKDWVVLSARVHGNGSPEHPAQQFYMLSVRHRQHARVREIQVVRAACKALLSNKHADALEEGRDLTTDDVFRMEASPLLEIIAKKQREYLASLRKEGAVALEKTEENINNKGDRTPALADNDDDENNHATEPLEDDLDSRPSAPLPRVQRECFNKHPQCEYWAERGECKANPGYMVGTATTGWCRAACFVCPHPQPVAPGGLDKNPTAIATIEKVSKDLLDSVLTTGCTRSSPCRGIDGNDAAKSRLAEAAGVDPERTAALQKATIISGPIHAESGVDASGSGSGGNTKHNGKSLSGVDAQLLDDSVVVTTLPINKAVIPKEEKKVKSTNEKIKITSSPVEKALHNELGGQCMYIANGWWSYEVCYHHSVTQFHMPGGQNAPEWIISLGEYASSDYTVRNMTVQNHKVGLFPVGSVIPYVSHQLESGNICELTGENGVNSLEQLDHGEDEGHGTGGGSIDAEKINEMNNVRGVNEGKTQDTKVKTTSSSTAGDGKHSKNSKKLKVGDQILRSTQLRFMCSPDMNKHIAVVEPEQCRYIVDVYVPALCRVHGMAPVLPEVPEVPLVPATDSSTNKESIRHRMDIDFDDPYVDPDEWEEL